MSCRALTFRLCRRHYECVRTHSLLLDATPVQRRPLDEQGHSLGLGAALILLQAIGVASDDATREFALDSTQ